MYALKYSLSLLGSNHPLLLARSLDDHLAGNFFRIASSVRCGKRCEWRYTISGTDKLSME